MFDYDEMNETLLNAISEEQLNDIDYEYYSEVIGEQIDNLMDTGSKKNFLKKFEENIDRMCDGYEDSFDYKKPIDEIKTNMYETIILKISKKFGFTVNLEGSSHSLKNVAKYMYKFFVLNYTDVIAQFLEIFISENIDNISNDIAQMNDVLNKKIENIPSKIGIILNNINSVVGIVIDRDISFDEFLEYICRHEDSPACAEKMKEYEDIIEDEFEIMNYILNSLENEEEGFSTIYTHVMQYLYQNYELSDENEINE